MSDTNPDLAAWRASPHSTGPALDTLHCAGERCDEPTEGGIRFCLACLPSAIRKGRRLVNRDV